MGDGDWGGVVMLFFGARLFIWVCSLCENLSCTVIIGVVF